MHFSFVICAFGCILQSQKFNFDEVLFLSFVTCPFDVLSKKSKPNVVPNEAIFSCSFIGVALMFRVFISFTYFSLLF